MRLFSCVCVLLVGVSCILCVSAKQPPKSASAAKTAPVAKAFTIFITGNELGRMSPCGCSEGQLGGFERRAVVLKSAPSSRRLIIDTGRLVQADNEQAQIKFEVITEAFQRLEYDLVAFAQQDIEMAQRLGMLENIGSAYEVISYQDISDANIPRKFTKEFSLTDRTLSITVVAFDPQSVPIEQAAELFAAQSDKQSVNILLAGSCDQPSIDLIAKTGVVDCLICPPESDKPSVISDPNNDLLVISEPRYGKYVGKLEIRFDQDAKEPQLRFSFVEINEKLPTEQSLVELYDSYRHFVKEANLLETHPRFPLPNGLQYVGSVACARCHESEFAKFKAKAHAHAYSTLEKVGSQYDPECVVCHVVGLDYESGFVSAKKTPQMENVGCEMCHGPGSAHIESWGVEPPGQPRSNCLDCHTPEQSANYAGNEQDYLQKILHWTEPNAPGNVK